MKRFCRYISTSGEEKHLSSSEEMRKGRVMVCRKLKDYQMKEDNNLLSMALNRICG